MDAAATAQPKSTAFMSPRPLVHLDYAHYAFAGLAVAMAAGAFPATGAAKDGFRPPV